MALIKKYYSGSQVFDIIRELPDKEFLLMLNAFAEESGAYVVEVRHGYFIGTEFDGYADGNPVYYEWKCSCCGSIFEEDERPSYNFCPNCGADMRERREDVRKSD